MKKIILSTGLLAVVLVMSGCSNKNILMPGKDSSDCELASGAHGVCGSPKSVYKAKNEISGLGYGTDDSYFVHDDGTIQEIEGGVLGDEVKVKTLPNGDKVAVKKGEDGEMIETPFSQGSVLLKNNSYMLGEEPDTVMVRNQEVIREAWINTYNDPYGNLAVEHRIMIITKEAGWALGEETPKNISKKRFLPSVISKEALLESHKKPSKKDNNKLRGYITNTAETPKEDQILQNYLKGK